MKLAAAALLVLAGCSEGSVARTPDAASTLVRTSTACSFDALVREESTIESAPGIRVFVMRVAARERRGAVLLTHGGGSPGSALWDLRTKDYSVMRNLACKGFDAYSLDVRGFGGSTKPEPPVVRLREVMADVEAAVRFALEKSKLERIDMVGWSWGSDVAAMYAGLHPEQVRRLVLFAPVYDRRWPERHKTDNGWYPIERAAFFEYHDPKKEDRAVLTEHVEQLFRFAKEEKLMLPNGPYLDLYGDEAPIWDASAIRAPTLIVRGDLDRASLDLHAQKLFAALTQAPLRRYVILGGADHFAFRTFKYRELRAVITAFLEE
jgi:pimeloyl-ACP methyl ester carboxylesterase